MIKTQTVCTADRSHNNVAFDWRVLKKHYCMGFYS